MDGHDLPDHRNGRALDPCTFRLFGNIFQSPCHHPLERRRPRLYHGCRSLRIFAVLYQLRRDIGQIFKPHQENQRTFFFRQSTVIQRRILLVLPLMSGDHVKGRSIIPVRHRNSRISRSAVAGRYSRHNLKFDPGILKLLGFFSSSSEDKRIPAL